MDKFYHQEEAAIAIKAVAEKGNILILGIPGSGKTALAENLEKQLKPKRPIYLLIRTIGTMLKDLAYYCNVDPVSVDDDTGKTVKLNNDQLMDEIAEALEKVPRILIIDDAQCLPIRFRQYLKRLSQRGAVYLILIALDVPKTDLFLAMPPPIEIKPLSDDQILELVTSRSAYITSSDLALIRSCGGNPGNAIAILEGQRLGIVSEVTPRDTIDGIDITPWLLASGVIFILMRVAGLATNNTTLYLLGGAAAAIAWTLFKLIRAVPKESRTRIKPQWR